jgi:DUF1680 family protein
MTRNLLATLILWCAFAPCFAQSYVPEAQQARIKIAPVSKIKAYSFNLSDVQLLPGSPFANARSRDSAYLLLLDPNRLLHRFYSNAGLPTKGDVYGGWESEGLSGHSLGHYLSACAMMYASTKNSEFKKRIDYIVSELAKCQTARKTGYVGAIPNEDSIFGKLTRGEIKSSGFDLNGGWSPWYTVHKLMAGLLDAYLYCGNKQALQVDLAMAAWTEKILQPLKHEQILKMLNCEYGGMNDVLVNLYSISGNRRWLDLSHKFHDEFVLGALAKQVDPLPGRHSNTNVPKAIGCARRFELAGDPTDSTIASFFWTTMVNHHSYVIGGNSNNEYCGERDKLNDKLSDKTCETCNTYNMLKLTRHLFSWNPGNEYADYYERALYNHILSSQNPNTGMMCYFVPLRMGTRKVFSDSFNTFTCCVGSGMENHSKYQEAIYYQGATGDLYLNLFIASKLNWKRKGLVITQQTNFPSANSTLLLFNATKAVEATIRLRNPYWSKDKISVAVNGKSIKPDLGADGYYIIRRTWKTGDRLEVKYEMDLHTESMPDNPDRIAILYGPLVMAGRLGSTMPDPVTGVPVLLTSTREANAWISPVQQESLQFKINEVGMPFSPTLVPFYQVVDDYYNVYWDYFTPQDWEKRKQDYEAEKKREAEIERKTVDHFRVGEMQPERDHELKASEKSYTDIELGRPGREVRAGGWFSFKMKLDSSSTNQLLLTYIGDDKDRKFDIIVNGNKIATVDWQGGETGKFYDHIYPIPLNIAAKLTEVTVRIEANYGKTAGRIFGCRIIRN